MRIFLVLLVVELLEGCIDVFHFHRPVNSAFINRDRDYRGEGSNSHDHLLASQQRVADELASSQSNGAVVVRHGCGVVRLSLGW